MTRTAEAVRLGQLIVQSTSAPPTKYKCLKVSRWVELTGLSILVLRWRSSLLCLKLGLLFASIPRLVILHVLILLAVPIFGK